MSTTTEEREVPSGPPPTFGESEQAFAWVPVTQAAPSAPESIDDDTPTQTRSEASAPRSHRKHIGAIGAAGGIVGGVALWQAFGIVGLLAAGGAAAGLVAAPVAAYAMYKRRGRNRTPMGRRLRGQRLNRRGAVSRMGSTGISKSRGRLGGRGGGPKLGKSGGPKLGRGGGKLLGGKGAKLGGKSGLGGGRSKSGGLLGSRGRGGKLLGGGRGSGLGGKSRIGRKGGLGLAGGSRARGRGVTAANRSGGLAGRAGRGGLKLGKRGGKAAHGALGRWSKSTGGGAGILGQKAGAAARRRAAKMAQRAANTRAGQRVAKAVQAAKRANAGSTAKSPFARWRAATRAAHSQMPRYGRSYSNWAAGVGAGVLALLALLEQRFKTWQAKRNEQAADSTKTTTGSTSSNRSSTGSGPRWESTTTHGDEFGSSRSRNRATPPPHPSQRPPTIKVEVIRDEPIPPKAITAPIRALGPGRPTEIDRKDPPMSENTGFPLLDIAMEFSAMAAKYKPPSAHDLAPEFDKLPEVIAHLAAGFRNYARRIDAEEPVEQPVSDALFQVFDTINKLAGPAEQVGPLHRKVHAADIARVEAPRRNEARWNT